MKEPFGSNFDLAFAGDGPTKAPVARLDDRRRDDLKRDFVVFHDTVVAPLGITMPRRYLLTVGRPVNGTLCRTIVSSSRR
jgi:hypothetical protein